MISDHRVFSFASGARQPNKGTAVLEGQCQQAPCKSESGGCLGSSTQFPNIIVDTDTVWRCGEGCFHSGLGRLDLATGGLVLEVGWLSMWVFVIVFREVSEAKAKMCNCPYRRKLKKNFHKFKVGGLENRSSVRIEIFSQKSCPEPKYFTF